MTDATTIDIGRAIGEGRWSAFQARVIFLCCLCFFVEGLDVQVLALAMPAIMADWNLPKETFSSVTALSLIGFAVGAFVGGYCGDAFGRRIALIGSVLLFGAATLQGGFARDIAELSVMRFAAGLGLGGTIPNGMALIAEFTPFRNRSFAIAGASVLIGIGAALSAFLAGLLMPTHGWQGFFVVSGSVGLVLAALLFVSLPESLHVLARNPNRADALRRAMKRMGHDHGSQTVFVGQARSTENRVGRLFSPVFLHPTIGLLGASFFVMLTFNVVLNWTPAILSESGVDMAFVSQAFIAFSLGSVTGNLTTGWTIRRFGLHPSFIVTTLSCLAGALVGAYAMGQSPPAFWIFGLAFVFLGAGLGGFQTCVFGSAVHIYPADVRATGTGAGVSSGYIGGIVSSWAGVWAYNIGGGQGYFLTVGLAMLLGFLSVAWMKNRFTQGS